MKQTTLIFTAIALALLVLAGCTAAAIPTPTPAVGYASSAGGDVPNAGLVLVELAMDHAPLVGETAVLTATFRPAWDYFSSQEDLGPIRLRVWIEMLSGVEAVELPPGVRLVTCEQTPFPLDCANALEGERVVAPGDALQLVIPLRFVTEGEGWGGYTFIGGRLWLFSGDERIPCPDSAYLDLTVTNDFSHFGYPEGWEDQPRYAEGETPPPTPLPGQVEEMEGTPPPTPPLPVITPPPYVTPQE